MLALDSPRWSELQHAYGSASDIPALLQQLEKFPDGDGQEEPWFSLWSALAHQSDVYSASFAAVPHVIEVLSKAPERAGSAYFHFPAWVEVCRHRKGIAIPDDLESAYTEALRKIPALVATAATREWSEDLLVCALAAIAAAKGYVSVAEATMELTPDVATEFMEWFFER